jgi:hypothetical protein
MVIPGVSCTQYSESGLVSNLFHVRIAPYLPFPKSAYASLPNKRTETEHRWS